MELVSTEAAKRGGELQQVREGGRVGECPSHGGAGSHDQRACGKAGRQPSHGMTKLPTRQTCAGVRSAGLGRLPTGRAAISAACSALGAQPQPAAFQAQMASQQTRCWPEPMAVQVVETK